MAKKFFVSRGEVSPQGFGYRSLSSSRLENLTDAILLDVCVLSMLIVLVYGGRSATLAGPVYALIGILLPLHRRIRNSKMNKLFT